jgi:hypothetical protein
MKETNHMQQQDARANAVVMTAARTQSSFM